MEKHTPIEYDSRSLYEEGVIIKFYNQRYSQGYMAQWPADKKKRILELIESLNLPKTGDALDFGCGNGEFTDILKNALPGWNIYGMDISSVAIDNAKKRYPHCVFFLQSDTRLLNKKFDFLFSYHVLEHVGNFSKIWDEVDRFMKPHASCLHVLPCGNPGSFEYNLCMLRKDGIDGEFGNRFAFEDKSHLRRLTTSQMDSAAISHNLETVFGFYSNQFYGALEWITLLSPSLIWDMTNPSKGKDITAKIKLGFLYVTLLLIKLMRFPANSIDYKKRKMENYKYYFLFFLLLIFYPLSKLTNIYLCRMSDLEWKNQRTQQNGSEMYLYYKRNLAA